MIERRQEPRQRSLLSGKIVFDDHNCSMDCTVRNVSEHGAMAVRSKSFRIPAEFDFVIPHREEAHRATVIWRKRDGVGLALSQIEAVPARPKPERKGFLQGSRRRTRKGMVLGY